MENRIFLKGFQNNKKILFDLKSYDAFIAFHKYYEFPKIINVELSKYLKGTDLGNAMKSGLITAEKAFKKLAEMPAREPTTDSGWVRRHAEIIRKEKKTSRKPAAKRVPNRVRTLGKLPLRPS